MKGLLLAVGLIAALFISNAYAGIYDTASYQSPKIQSTFKYKCSLNSGGSNPIFVKDSKECIDKTYALHSPQSTIVSCSLGTFQYDYNYISCRQEVVSWDGSTIVSYFNKGRFYPAAINDSESRSCPPDEFPLYTFPVDNNSDGKDDQCYNPAELDNLSKCSDLFNSGSILTAGGNTASLVCKTFEDGSRCAFSRVEQGSTPYYQPNLEKGCFGDAEEIPDYDKDAPPAPQPEQCVPYFGGFACAADPKNYCSSNGSCIDGCGYVNDQFMCFRDEQCKGASCEPAPVNCETVPDAPICKDKETTPQPSFCEKNPTLESCQGGSNFCKKNPLAPSCQLGGDGGGTGGGGSDFVLDYDKLINGMKDAVKLIIDPNETPEFSEFKSEIDDKTSELDSEIDNFMNGSHFDGINDQISSNPFTGQFQLPSGGGCTAFDLGGHSLDLCGAAQKISSVLYYVFSFLTLLYLKNLFFSTVTPRKE